MDPGAVGPPRAVTVSPQQTMAQTMLQLPQQTPIGYPPQNASGVPPAAPRAEQLAFADFFGMLRRHRLAFVLAVVLSTLAALAVAVVQTPRYSAWTELLIDLRKPNVLEGSGSIIPDIPVTSNMATAAIRGEIAQIGSNEIVGRVVDRLGLVRDPEFNVRLAAELAPPPSAFEAWLDGLRAVPGALLDGMAAMFGFGSDEEAAADGEGERAASERVRVMRSVARNLTVANDGRSFVLSIGFSSENPRKAALIANTFAEEYLASQVRLKQEALRRAQDWLNERIVALRAEVEQSNQSVLELRDRNQIVELQNGTVTAQQLAELNSQLILARSSRAQAEARLRSATQLTGSSGRYDGTLEVFQASAVQGLKQQEGDLRRREAELASRLGPRHPDLIQVRAELEAIRGKIDDEIGAIVRGLQNEVNVAISREASLEQALAALEQRATTAGRTQMEILQIDQEAETSRTLLDSVLTRYKELIEQTDLLEPDARTISEAAVPLSPVGLGRKQIVAAGLGLGAILGIIVVLVLEQVTRGFRSSEEAERLLGMPVLGAIPRLRFGRWRNPADYVVDRPLSVYAESLRRLFATIRLMGRLRQGSVLVVSSAIPNEGKTTLVLSLARMLAGAGVRILVIEGDLRRPSLSSVFLPEDPSGLCEVLAGQRELATTVVTDPRSGAHVLLAGRPASDPADILDPRRVRGLFDEARRRYDLVLVDTAPAMVISDTIVMAEQADAVILATRWSSTPRKVSVKAAALLRECGANLVGTVLSRVETRAEQDVGAVYRSAKRYYAN
jgi:succinoglycan biosynthesis transport protein ExoP